MNSQITGLRVASVVFGLMALAQLVRLVIRPEVLVAGHPMPLWPNVLAFIIIGRPESVDVETRSHADQMNESGTMLPNKIGRANRRAASLFNAGRQFGRAVHAPPSLSAAVAHLCRSARSVFRSDRNPKVN